MKFPIRVISVKFGQGSPVFSIIPGNFHMEDIFCPAKFDFRIQILKEPESEHEIAFLPGQIKGIAYQRKIDQVTVITTRAVRPGMSTLIGIFFGNVPWGICSIHIPFIVA